MWDELSPIDSGREAGAARATANTVPTQPCSVGTISETRTMYVSARTAIDTVLRSAKRPAAQGSCRGRLVRRRDHIRGQR